MIAITLLALAGATPSCAVADAALRKTLDRHVTAIRSRDMAGIEATITAGDRLPLILPGGQMSETRAEFLAVNREFFADSSWSMTFTCRSVIEARDMAVATYAYAVVRPAATTRAWLTLTFRRERGRWALVHDQNTRIAD